MTTFAVVERVSLFRCSECEKNYEEEEVSESPLYECDCGSIFNRGNSANDNHQCPDCSKFAHKLSEYSCPEGCEVEIEEVPALKDTENGGILYVLHEDSE